MIEKSDWKDRIYITFSYVFVAVFALACLMPFLIMVASSFTDDLTLRMEGYALIHSKWTLKAYQFVLRGTEVQKAYLTSIIRTVVGTLGSILVMSGTAYALSLKRLKGRNFLAFYVYFTMVFSPSLIPWFVFTRNALQLHDSMLAIILPMMVSAYWIMIMKNFFSSIPNEIIESAYVDGASDVTILFRIILPLSLPVLATSGLFMAIGYWNDWFLPLMLIDTAQIRPLPLLIIKILNNIQSLQEAVKIPGVIIPLSSVPAEAVRMATAVVVIGPIILLYPFLQRYFIKGLTIGAVKG
jgi:ABC-type glycerol-3-phosphate transport system permease component